MNSPKPEPGSEERQDAGSTLGSRHQTGSSVESAEGVQEAVARCRNGEPEGQRALYNLFHRRLIYVAEVRKRTSGDWLVERYLLQGKVPQRIESGEVTQADADELPRPEALHWEETESGGTALSHQNRRELHPLVHYDQESNEFFFLNSRCGRSAVEYLCYTSGRVIDLEPLLHDKQQFLARLLNVQVTTEQLADWAAQSFAEDVETTADKYDDGVRRIGEFEILSRIDKGGMGVVYRAWQPSLSRQVALKSLLRSGDPKTEARFAREIQALGRVDHPNLIKVFTSGVDGDEWFYTMELVDGANLASICTELVKSEVKEIGPSHWRQELANAIESSRIKEVDLSQMSESSGFESAKTQIGSQRTWSSEPVVSRVPAGRRSYLSIIVRLIRQVCQAAHALHLSHVVHRDIKPGNIIVAPDGSHAILMDLGLAHLSDDTEGRLTRTRQFVGTLRYASPEQVLAAGQIDPRTVAYLAKCAASCISVDVSPPPGFKAIA